MTTAAPVLIPADQLRTTDQGRVVGGPGAQAVLLAVNPACGGIHLRVRILASGQVVDQHVPSHTIVLLGART